MSPTSYVYFIQCGGPYGLVKIGSSFNPPARLKDLQVGCPDELRLIATLLGDQKIERMIHRFLDQIRVRGEWFLPSEKMAELIRDLQARQGITG